VLSLAVKDNVTLFAGLQGGTIRIFDLTTFSTIRVLSSGPADVLALCIAGDSCLATTASGQLQVEHICQARRYSQAADPPIYCKTWNSSFTLIDSIQAHSEIALSCASSISGAYLYSGGNDATIKVWQAMSSNISKQVQSESLQGRARLLQYFIGNLGLTYIASQVDYSPCLANSFGTVL
jgi:di- and tripeptidase